MRMRAQLSFVLSQITRLSDRETDGHTDSFLAARPRCMHCMQRGKTSVRQVYFAFVFSCSREGDTDLTQDVPARTLWTGGRTRNS